MTLQSTPRARMIGRILATFGAVMLLAIIALNVGITPQNATWWNVGAVALVLTWTALPFLGQIAGEKKNEGLSTLCVWLFILPIVYGLYLVCAR
jgi:hypothetical protein